MILPARRRSSPEVTSSKGASIPGAIIRVIPKQSFDFSTWPVNQTALLLMAKAVDISQYREASLIGRIHSWSTVGGSPTVAINVRADAPTSEDPGIDFISSADLATLTFTLTAGQTGPATNFTAVGSANLPAFLRVYMTPTQLGPATTFKFTISADIYAKS